MYCMWVRSQPVFHDEQNSVISQTAEIPEMARTFAENCLTES